MPDTGKLTQSASILLVRDLLASAAYYRDVLGFFIGQMYNDPPSFTIIRRDGMFIMLKQVADHGQIVPRRIVSPGLWDVYFWVDDVEALFKTFTAGGANIDYPPYDQFYGCRDFAILDPDGHSIGFGQIMTKP
jgi:catechol 2,3-dioxygenase-like lactoylglutathione lyase family enzyme